MEIPTPPRPLGREGALLWERIWAFGKPWIETVDLEHLAIMCESMDERVILRMRVIRDNEWRDRVGLRALDAQIVTMLAALGLNPSDRMRLNLALEEPPDNASPLGQIRHALSVVNPG